eukprot:Nk52_evm6s161 gene=Nk52_evmTU6s161
MFILRGLCAVLVVAGCFLAFPVAGENFIVGSVLPHSSFPGPGIDALIGLLAGLERYAKNIEGGHTVVWLPNTTYHLDDASQPLLGLVGASSLIQKGAVLLFGAWNSAVSTQVNTLATSLGVLQISGGSTSTALTEKKNFPTFVRTMGNNQVSMAVQALLVKHYGWKMVAIISTDDVFALDQAKVFRAECLALGIEVTTLEVLPFDIDRLNKRHLVAPKLSVIKNSGAKIIFMPNTAVDSRTVVEEAEKLNMIGNKEFLWLTGTVWLSDSLFTNWPHEKSMVGAIGLKLAVNMETSNYKEMQTAWNTIAARDFNRVKDAPEVWTAMHWDAARLFVVALNATIKRITALNIAPSCLSYTSQTLASCQIPITERDSIMADAESNQYNGVIEYLKLFADEDSSSQFGLYARYPNVILLHELYRVDFQGASGRVKLNKNGDNTNSFEITNFKQTGAGKDGTNGRAATYSVDVVGLVDVNTGVTISKPVHFPGGTFDNPNLTPTVDSTPATDGGGGDSMTIIIVAASCGGVVILLIIAIVWYVRRARRLEMLKNMTWLIPEEDVEVSSGTKSAIGTCLTFTSQQQQSQASKGGGSASIQGSMHAASRRNISTGLYKGTRVILKPLYSPGALDLGRDDIMNEMFYLTKTCRNNNLNPFIGFLSTKQTQGLLSKNLILQGYCEKGSLEDLIHLDDMDIDSTFIFAFTSDILNGLKYLHSTGSMFGCHGRLKPSNCVVDSRWTCKLNDYGIEALYQRCVFDLENNDMVCNKLLWTAPELLEDQESYYAIDCSLKEQLANMSAEEDLEPLAKELQKREYPASDKGDIWALGIIVLQMISRTYPFEHLLMDARDIVNGLKDGSVSPTPESDVDPSLEEVQNFALTCAEFDPSERPSVKSAVASIKKINPNSGSLAENMAKMLEKYSKTLENIVADRTKQLVETTEKVKNLLYEMLPIECADKLIAGEVMVPENFDCVTIFFSDIVGFTKIANSSTPIEVVNFLNALYTTFDQTLEKRDVYKVETIGDAYMIVSGLPTRNGNDHIANISLTALHLMANMTDFQIPHLPGKMCQLRVGIHTGPVVAGVVGLKMPRYCLFGDTVNTASRMESGGYALHIHLSSSSASLLQEHHPNFSLEKRGEIQVKGKGTMVTFWLKGEKDFDRKLPDISLAASKEEHEFK